MFKVGFTGTQVGCTVAQLSAFRLRLTIMRGQDECEFHHGDCVGADAQAHAVAAAEFFRTVCHPPIANNKRAFTSNDFTHEPKEYLDRNRDIVNDTYGLIACPRGMEELRSGTWATVRYARKVNRPVMIIWPDGTFQFERVG